MTEIQKMKKKTKIILEYPTGYQNRGTKFTHIDLNKVYIKVSTKNGGEYLNKDIDFVTIKAKVDKD